MRKLASIQEIRDIRPIEGADAIEVATVNNWNVVVKKGEYKIGDFAIYCEIDSFLPIRDEFEFLRKSSFKKMADREGFRLRTIKLRGQVSQGLLITLSVLPDSFWENQTPAEAEGTDVSDLLDIVKYEAPIPAQLAGKVRGNFPSWIPKTDEERVQNLTKEYNDYQNMGVFYETEKLDGSSITVYLDHEGTFGVCSRNLDLTETEDNTLWSTVRKMDIESKMRNHFSPNGESFGIALQGEIIGEGIQGNRYGIKGQTIRFYNVWDGLSAVYYRTDFFRDAIEQMGLETVPYLGTIDLNEFTIPELLQRAESKSTLNPKAEREGVVIRSTGRDVSFKVISNKFLLKGGE